MGVEMYNLGYYICQIEKTPPHYREISDKWISASDCLCTHEPQIILCHGWKPNGDNAEYMKKLNLNYEQYLKFSSEAQNLFDNRRLFLDGRFTCEEEAKYIYNKYFKSDRYLLISIATEELYFDEMVSNFYEQDKQQVSLQNQKVLGCDILGYDILENNGDGGHFHSFLCNHLQQEFKDITFSEYGLIDMEYLTVKEMAETIQGLGEPFFDWVPVVVCLLEMW